jgi:hypothetical protein
MSPFRWGALSAGLAGLWILKSGASRFIGLILDEQYAIWAFRLARCLLRVAGALCPWRLREWEADLKYVQGEGYSGLPQAGSCLVSAPWLLGRRVVRTPAALTCLLLLATLAVVCGLIYSMTKADLYAATDARLSAAANSFSRSMGTQDPSASGSRGVPRFVMALPGDLSISPTVSWLQNQSFSLGGGAAVQMGDRFWRPSGVDASLLSKPSELTTGWNAVSERTGGARALTVPILSPAGQPAGRFIVWESRAAAESELSSLVHMMVLAGSVGFVFAMLLWFVAVRRFSMPTRVQA